MIDPGTAVGIISLGLQVLQGLATFYEDFASFNIELSTVVRRIESLYMIIDALEGPVRDLERDDLISAAVRQCIEACKAEIQELEVYRKKCGSSTQGPTVKKNKLHGSKSRVLFPFRKAILDDLVKALDRLQSNLDTVVLALQL
jgi:hypothetical protein